MAGWMAVTSCQQLWQMLQAVSSFESCYKLLTVFTAVISCQQFLQLLQAVDSFESCYKLLTVISVVTSCWQLWQLSHGVNSCETETSCQQLSLHKQALDSFDNYDSFCKQLAALTAKATLTSNSLHHQSIHQPLISILISKGQFVQFLTISSVSESVIDIGRLWSHLGLMKIPPSAAHSTIAPLIQSPMRSSMMAWRFEEQRGVGWAAGTYGRMEEGRCKGAKRTKSAK